MLSPTEREEFEKEFPYGVMSGEDNDLDITDELLQWIDQLLAKREVEQLK